MEYPVFKVYLKAKTLNEARITAAHSMFPFEDPTKFERAAFRDLIWRLKVAEVKAEQESDLVKDADTSSDKGVEKKLPPFLDDWDMLSESEWRSRIAEMEEIDEEDWIAQKGYYGQPIKQAPQGQELQNKQLLLPECCD